MTDPSHHNGSEKRVAILILCAIGLYAVSLAANLPQLATEAIVGAQSHHAEASQGEESQTVEQGGSEAHGTVEDDGLSEDVSGVPDAAVGDGARIIPPRYFWVTPFVLLLAAIAIFPLLKQTEHWWENNLYRFYVAAGLGLVTIGYYAFLHNSPIEGHFPAHHIVDTS